MNVTHTLPSSPCIIVYFRKTLLCVCMCLICCCFLITLEDFLGSEFRLNQLCNLRSIHYKIYRKVIDLILSILSRPMPKCKTIDWLHFSVWHLLINELLHFSSNNKRVTGARLLAALSTFLSPVVVS